MVSKKASTELQIKIRHSVDYLIVLFYFHKKHIFMAINQPYLSKTCIMFFKFRQHAIAILFCLLPLQFVMSAAAHNEKHKTVKVEFEVVFSLSERMVDPFIIEVTTVH